MKASCQGHFRYRPNCPMWSDMKLTFTQPDDITQTLNDPRWEGFHYLNFDAMGYNEITKFKKYLDIWDLGEVGILRIVMKEKVDIQEILNWLNLKYPFLQIHLRGETCT